MWLHVSPIFDKIFESQDRERRLEFVEAAVRQETNRVKENPNYNGPNGGPPGEFDREFLLLLSHQGDDRGI